MRQDEHAAGGAAAAGSVVVRKLVIAVPSSLPLPLAARSLSAACQGPRGQDGTAPAKPCDGDATAARTPELILPGKE